MKRVLMIAYYFPPVAASGSVRPAAFCRYLPESGWVPIVVTVDGSALDRPLATDPSLCSELAADLDVVRVAHGNPNQFLLRARDQFLALFGRHRQAVSGDTSGSATMGIAQGRRGTIRRSLDRMLERLLLFPDPQKFWARPALRACEAIIAARRPDVIFATGGPWTSLLLGERLSARHGIPFVADFRDPWAINPYLTYASPGMQQRAELLEAEVCAHAAAVIANTEELAESFRDKYPHRADRVVAISNGFDASLPRQSSVSEPVVHRLVLTHLGTVYVKRSPLPLFEAVNRLVSGQPDLVGRLLLNFTGEWEIQDPACNQLASRLELQGLLQRASRIDREECLARMATSQVLLVIQEGTPMQIPAKLYEYISMRRPLVILGGAGATANLVQKHRLGVCCANEVDAIEALLRAIIAGDMCLDLPSESVVMRFEYRALTARLAAVLNRVSGNAGNTSMDAELPASVVAKIWS